MDNKQEKSLQTKRGCYRSISHLNY